MKLQPTRVDAMRKVQAMAFFPILVAFTLGSLPVLLPLALYRWLAVRAAA